MTFPIPISEWCICHCGKADWQVINIDVDEGIEERIKRYCHGKYRRRFLKELEEGKLSRKIYILTIRCRQCGFTWTKFVTERMLKGVGGRCKGG